MAFARVAALSVVMLVSLGGAATAADPPANGWVAFSSNRQAGRHEIYVMPATPGGAPVRLTMAGGIYPAWAPDGSWLAYQNTAENTTHVVRPDGTGDKKVCDGALAFWMHDGSGLVCAVLRTDWVGWEGTSRSEQYLLVHPDLGTSVPLFGRSDFAHLTDNFGGGGIRHLIPGGVTHDGRWLVGWVFGLFEQGYTADNGRYTSTHASVLLDLTDKSKLYYLGPGCTTTTPPTGDLVYHVSREGGTAPDVYALDVHDVATRSGYRKVVGRVDNDWGHDYFPRVSSDNRWLVYGASQGCHPWYDCDYEIFLHELGAPDTTSVRLTTSPSNDNYPSMFVGEVWKSAPQELRVQLSPNRLAFFAAAPNGVAARTIVVHGAEGKAVNGAVARVSYPAGVPAWLDVTAADEGATTRLTVTPRPEVLGPGTHTASLSVEVADAAHGPRVVPITLHARADAIAPDAGAPEIAPDGGTPNFAPDAGAPDVIPADVADVAGVATASDGSGCDCQLGGSSSGVAPWLLLAALVGLYARLARRRTAPLRLSVLRRRGL